MWRCWDNVRPINVVTGGDRHDSFEFLFNYSKKLSIICILHTLNLSNEQHLAETKASAQQLFPVGPVISGCPRDKTVIYELGERGVLPSWLEPRATDNSGYSILNRKSGFLYQPGFLLTEGSTTVSYVFSDASGNEAVCSFVVTASVGECYHVTVNAAIKIVFQII